MKATPAEQREMAPDMSVREAPEYPWGLRVQLEDESLMKLDLLTLPAVGESLMLHARVHVCRVTQSDAEGEPKRRSVELQITDLALEPDRGEADMAQRLYG